MNINSVSQGVNEQYTLSQLLQLPQHEIRTNIPWTNKTHTYSGPYLEDVLALANVSGQWLTMYALDRYQIDFNFNRIKKYKPILALSVDRKKLTIRTKGPIWVILPMDDYAELDAAVYHDFMVWQLVKINVEEKSNDDAL
ncbi:molybdopterin-binding oxidoreductase [Psychromonas sp. Urea-02u-13]|uniref:molybdopterin-binding oxidoreductase n=1 Tax=Psychromonas sp. Urea-02u-13 TaxID=2058326 RepID=UPI0012FF2403|nr:molybdopterin-binding oxidoreductase [Psychromonas sp. Urea-02u-13]